MKSYRWKSPISFSSASKINLQSHETCTCYFKTPGREKKSIQKAEEHFYWCNLKVDMRQYVKNCVTCRKFKNHPGLQKQWQEVPPVNKPLERIGIDLTDMVSEFR